MYSILKKYGPQSPKKCILNIYSNRQNIEYEKKERLKVLTKGFEPGTSGFIGQYSTTELKFLYNMMDTNF